MKSPSFNLRVASAPAVLFAFTAALFASFVAAPFAQAADNEGWEQTLFGLRRVTKGVTPAVSPSQPPPSSAISSAPPALAKHALAGTTWCCINPWNNAETNGITEFIADGSFRHFAKVKKWSIIDEKTVNTVNEPNEIFTLFDEGNVLMQKWEYGGWKFRLWYKGRTPPPLSNVAREIIVNRQAKWRNDELDSTYQFRADGTFVETFSEKIKYGTWKPLYGNVIAATPNKETLLTFTLASDGAALIRNDTKIWKRTAPAATVLMPNSQTQTAPNSQTVATDLAALDKQYADFIANSMTGFNRRDKASLESLKKRMGINDLSLLEEVQKAISFVESNENFEAPEPVRSSKSYPYAQEFYRIKTNRDKSISDVTKNAVGRYKNAYENLKKRAITANDFTLAKQIEKNVNEMNLLFSPARKRVSGRWGCRGFASNGEILFKEDGTYNQLSPWQQTGKWKMVSESSIQICSPHPDSGVFQIERSGKHMKGISNSGHSLDKIGSK